MSSDKTFQGEHRYVILLIIFLALLIRLFRFPELSWFYGDQGIDLIVAQRALNDGEWPMVGPYLGVPNFFVPPTYYWLLTAFLWIGKTPETVTLFFVGMDIGALIVLYKLARLLVDRETGIIAAALYAISVTTVNQARSMWQPHPVQLFLVASLYFLARSSFVMAWGLYGVALSIYPSPIALFPLFFYHTWRWVKGVRWVEWVRAVSLAFFAFSVLFVPWAVFEFWHGWPTHKALFTGSFGPMRWQEIGIQFFLNLFGLVSEVFSPWSLHPRIPTLIVPVVVALFGAGFTLVKRRLRRAFSFLSPFWLFVGLTSLLLYREMNSAWHRLWGFLPFLFLALAFMLRVGLRWSSISYRAVVFLLAGLYVLGNGFALYEQFYYGIGRFDDHIRRSRRVAVAIDASARARELGGRDFSVIAYTPTDYWSYAVTPELYFLRELREYPIPVTLAGNDVDRALWGHDGRPFIYLLCKEYTRQEDIERTCLGTFMKRNPNYHQEKRLLFDGDTTIFLFRHEYF